MTETKPKRRTKKTNPPQKSKRLLSFREYMLGQNIRREEQAAIRIKLSENEFHSREEWDKIVKDYKGEVNGL